jgi:isopentenyl phosphate kinase
VIERLGGEIGRVAAEKPYRLIVGHGSGSFGHRMATRFGLAEGIRLPAQLTGISLTQERAAMLHRYVIGALSDAEARPFSIAPSSCVVAAAGKPVSFLDEPLFLALDHGLLPVIYGDIAMDRQQVAAVCSTERLFEMIVPRLLERGWTVRRVVWLGETDGLYDAEGRTVPRVSAENFEEAARAIGDPAGADVTGGMRHRLETALSLAQLGIPSLLANGLTPGLLERAVQGGPVPGTLIL